MDAAVVGSKYLIIGGMQCLLFSLPRSGKEAKVGVEFRYSTLNVSKLGRKYRTVPCTDPNIICEIVNYSFP